MDSSSPENVDKPVDPVSVLKTIEKLTESLKGEIRMTIFVYLLIYKELSLSGLSKLLNKPKTSVFHHVKKLVESGLLEKNKKAGMKDVYYSV